MEEIEKDLSNYDLIYALKHMRNGFKCIKQLKKIDDENIDVICDEHISAITYYIGRLKKNKNKIMEGFINEKNK